MTRTRNMSDLLDSSGDIKSGRFDNLTTDVVGDTTPQLGGNLDTNGNDINFADNDKLTFGTSSDFEITHNTSNTVFKDTGAGNMRFQTTGTIQFGDEAFNETFAEFNDDGAVTLYYDNALKLATTSTGVDVTGGLDVQSTSGTTTDIGTFEAAVGGYTGTSLVAANTLGPASTYNLFKCITDSDADAGGPFTEFVVRGDGKVGIGTALPDTSLHISADASARFRVEDTTNNVKFDVLAQNSDVKIGTNSNHDLRVMTNNTEQVRITSGGNVGIDATSPVGRLQVGGSTVSSDNKLVFGKSVTTAQSFFPVIQQLSSDGAASDIGIGATSTSGKVRFFTGASSASATLGAAQNTERMTIDSSGDIGIGTSSITNTSGYRNIHIDSPTSGMIMRMYASGTQVGQIQSDTNEFQLNAVASDPMVFKTANTERMRILAGGGLTFNGDTAAANALDDYEEGNFTPNYVGFSISSVSSNNGRYTKIGNTVMVQVDLQQVTWTNGTGHLGISNLPFAGGAQRAFTGTFAWYYLVNNLATTDSLHGYIAGGASSMMMYASQSGHIWHTIVTPSSGSNGYFNGTFWYRT